MCIYLQATPNELILRRLLYDVALDLGPFLSCDTSSDVQYKGVVILWLFVTNSAVQFARCVDNIFNSCKTLD